MTTPSRFRRHVFFSDNNTRSLKWGHSYDHVCGVSSSVTETTVES